MISLRTAAAVAVLSALAAPAFAQTIERSLKVEPGGVYEIVFNPADNTVLIAATGARGQNQGSIVRLAASTLVPGQAIDVSAAPVFGLGLNSKTQILYGTSARGGAVSVIDARTGVIVATVMDGDDESPHVREVIVDERRNKAYVTVVGGEAGDTSRPNQIWVIDGATHTLERKIEAPVGSLTGAALDVERNRLFVIGMGSGDVAAIDLTTGQWGPRWPLGSERPTNVAYDSRGGRLFVASQGGGDLTVLNAVDGRIIHKVATGEGALDVAYNPSNDQIYVANRQAGTVTVVSGADYSVLANLATGTFPQTLAIDAVSNAVYVTNKARGLPRDAAPGTPTPEDSNGDTVTIIRP
jgi:YVTN family beta-propeller protein